MNRSGLEYSEPGGDGFLAAAGCSLSECEEMVREWRANIVRLPFNQDWALNGRWPNSAEDYLSAIDQMVEWLASLGCYTLLDLQWLSADLEYGTLSAGEVNRVAPLPNGDTGLLWETLALRYRDEPAVLFDLFNEPHDPLVDDDQPLLAVREDGETVALGVRRVSASTWKAWARYLISRIREPHPDSLIFVGGTRWAYDLRGMELDLDNIVYSTHVYPGSTDHGGPPWPSAFGSFARAHPVFAGEWGGDEADLDWGVKLAGYLRALGIGWTSWSWRDRPHLIEAATAWKPTVFGTLVRDELREA
ncbi:MAG: cellulase family glycosylhydrolase [Bryobacteraceae bacterium]